MGRTSALSLALVLVAGCSVVLDLDELEGHPCSGTGECLDGYVCQEGTCVVRTGDVDPCDDACTAAERCDEDTGLCVPFCEGIICGSGQACVSAVGGCTPVSDELGRPCVADADCAGLIPGCTTDPASPGDVSCVCMVAASSTDGTGVCLGLPTDPSDCSVCGSSRCVRLPFSSADRATGTAGLAATRALCAHEGFSGCDQADACEGSQETTVCTYLSWAQDPGFADGRVPWGFVAACASPSAGATVPIGSGCDPAQPSACATGLCLSMGGGTAACTAPCRADSGCGLLGAAAGGTASCVRAPISLSQQAGSLFDVAAVCGTGPSLGQECSAAPECRTDAPECAGNACTRGCSNGGDCDPNAGVECVSGQCR